MNEVKIKISDNVLEDYKSTATKWQSTLLELPISQAQDVLKYMRGVTGLRGKMNFPAVNAKSEFGPYDPDRVTGADVKIDYRTLETHMGSVIEKFHPNDYAMLTMGYTGATSGEGQKRTSPTLLVLSQLSKARGESLAYAVFNGKRNAEGSTTADLFDGFNTIADAEIEAGNISVAKKNLFKVTVKPDDVNACDIAKEVVRAASPYLRRQKAFLFCSQEFYDQYCESYLTSHAGVSYNKEYNQVTIEGSNGNVTLLPLAELEGTTKFYLTPGSNLLWGTDNKSDESFTQVDRFESFRLTFSATMFFGVQFHSIDPRMLMVVDLSEATDATDATVTEAE